jgi:hypothetical protein
MSHALVEPELLLYNRNVATLDPYKPRASAVAIANRCMPAVGDDPGVLPLAGNATFMQGSNERRVAIAAASQANVAACRKNSSQRGRSKFLSFYKPIHFARFVSKERPIRDAWDT